MLSFDTFIDTVAQRGKALYRDFAWRKTNDPYAVLVSEVMLQQTQTTRVERYFDAWMQRFPSIDALAAASTADVLELWQGLGYNRRALALKRAAEQVCEQYEGVLPADVKKLCELPGIGPATAGGVLAFAYNQHAVYLETNVRAVLLHELYPQREGVSDRELCTVLMQINERLTARDGSFGLTAHDDSDVEARGGSCALVAQNDCDGSDTKVREDSNAISARFWYYALLDYGAYLKKTYPNPSRRSKHHSRQSPYEGSRRQKRARLLEAILANSQRNTLELAELYDYDPNLTESILNDLAAEGFIHNRNGCWTA